MTETPATGGTPAVDSPADWPAPFQASPLNDPLIVLPGSKSLTNRYLVLAAQAAGTSALRKPLASRDTLLMASALRSLGSSIDTSTPNLWSITPGTTNSPVTVDCGLAGTVMRFLPPLALFSHAPVTFDGDETAYRRPMDTTIASLQALGGQVAALHDAPRLPFTVTPPKSAPTGPVEISIDASSSSQFVSGLLLIGHRFPHGFTLKHTGENLPSLPHINMTISVLRAQGIEIDDSTPHVWQVSPGTPEPLDLVVEPDLSNAGPFLAAALVAGGTVRIADWPIQTTQVGDQWRQLLPAMGAEVSLTEGVLSVTGHGRIAGGVFDLSEAGELAPTVAGLAALAESETTLTGIAHLRGHETDRLAALAQEINGLGGDVRETADGLTITPRPLHSGLFHTYHDHRMATTGALIGLKVPGVVVENIATTQKTLPDFAGLWAELLSGTATEVR